MDIPREIAGDDLRDREHFLSEVVESCRPVVIRGLARDWPAVRAGEMSPQAFSDYLAPFDAGGSMEAYFGRPEIAGKYYYNDDLRGFNFERRRMLFSEAVRLIVASLRESLPGQQTSGPLPGQQTIYVGSVPANDYLPGFAAANPQRLLDPGVGPRIWLGHAANVASHYDTLDNLACVIAGRRRFTLYAPELIAKLYVGPIDNTMAGQPVSLAASGTLPQGSRYPLFEQIRDQALVTELLPGDALYLPKLWWHQVESTAPFNVLINYWWDAFSAGPDSPYTALLLSMIAIAERPAEERRAWSALFDHYVFRAGGHPLAHLPPEQHGLLGPLKPDNYGRIRARIMHLLRGG